MGAAEGRAWKHRVIEVCRDGHGAPTGSGPLARRVRPDRRTREHPYQSGEIRRGRARRRCASRARPADESRVRCRMWARRGNEPSSDARERGNLPTDVDPLSHGARGQREAEERPIAGGPSRVAPEGDPKGVRTGRDRSGVPWHAKCRGHAARRHGLARVVRRQQKRPGERSDDRARDDRNAKPATARIARRRQGAVHVPIMSPGKARYHTRAWAASGRGRPRAQSACQLRCRC